MIGAAAVALAVLAVCPAAGEGPRDCPWAGIARDAAAGDAAVVLAREAPVIWRQLADDRGRPALHALWGESRNRDEVAGKVIVAPGILAALARRAGLTVRGERVPAGLTHTYGYLFSVLATPFGFKRARWVDGVLEAGLSLPPGVLGPTPPEGTLYGNATWVLARIALEDARARRLLDRLVVPEALRRFDPSALRGLRLEERVRAGGRAVVLRTDCLAFPAPGRFTHLVVYSIDDGRGARLLTAFPVDANFQGGLEALARSPEPVRARFNAWVDGLPTAGLPGTRRVLRR